MSHATRERWPWTLRGPLPAAAVFAFLVAAYLASPVADYADAAYTLLVSENLLLHRELALDRYFPPHADSRTYSKVARGETLPRHVQETDDELHYIYPHGSSVLSVPFVAVYRLFGLSAVTADGRFDGMAEQKMQRLTAAILCAMVGVAAFFSARLLLPVGWSVFVAVATGLGTQLWSSASRGLWSHTWCVVLLSAACFILLRASLERGGLHPVLLATLLSWSFFVRPTAAIYIVPLTLVVVARFRPWRRTIPYLVTGAVWLGLFVVYSFETFGQWLPGYFLKHGAGLGRRGLDGWITALAGQLWSPSRGFLVYVPVVLLVAYGLIAHRRAVRCRALAIGAGAGIVLHALVIASFPTWWGGYSYGPRLATDSVPLLALLGILALRAAIDVHREAEGRLRAVLEVAALLIAVGVGVVLNGAGALSPASREWNKYPVPLARDSSRAFEWRRSQFMVALFPDLLEEPAEEFRPFERNPVGRTDGE